MRYAPEVLSVEKLTDGNIGPGTQFLSRIRFDGKGVFESVEEIVDFDWGHRITQRIASGTRSTLGVLTFEPVQSGTRLTYRFQSVLSYAGALYGQGLLRAIQTSEMRRRRLAIWGRLEQVLESDAAA